MTVYFPPVFKYSVDKLFLHATVILRLLLLFVVFYNYQYSFEFVLYTDI